MISKTINIESNCGLTVTTITATSALNSGKLLDTKIELKPFFISGQQRNEFLDKLETLIQEYYI